VFVLSGGICNFSLNVGCWEFVVARSEIYKLYGVWWLADSGGWVSVWAPRTHRMFGMSRAMHVHGGVCMSIVT
jgi:hypothetical protein